MFSVREEYDNPFLEIAKKESNSLKRLEEIVNVGIIFMDFVGVFFILCPT